MRRALRAVAPAMSHLYGIQPWDHDRLTFGEVQAYLADLDRHMRAQADTEQQMQRLEQEQRRG